MSVWVLTLDSAWEDNEEFGVTLVRTEVLLSSDIVGKMRGSVIYTSHSYQFLFGIERNSPGEDLVSAYAFLISKPTALTWEMVTQFQDRYGSTASDPPDSIVEKVMQLVNFALTVNRSDDTIRAALGVSGLILVPKAPMHTSLSVIGDVLEAVEGRAAAIVAGAKDWESLVLRGVTHQMQINCARNEVNWLRVLLELKEFDEIFSELSGKVEFQQVGSATAITDIAGMRGEEVQARFLAEIIEKSDSFPAIFACLKRLSAFSPEMCSLTDFQKDVNRCVNRSLSLSDISDMIKILEDAPVSLLALLHNSPLSTRIRQFDYESCEPVPASFRVYSIILTSKYVLSKLEKKSLLHRFVLKCRFPVSLGVAGVCDEDEETAVEMWRIWLKSISSLAVARQVEVVDGHLSQIQDVPISAKLSDIFVSAIQTYCEDPVAFCKMQSVIATTATQLLRTSFVRGWKQWLEAMESDGREKVLKKGVEFALGNVDMKAGKDEFDNQFAKVCLEACAAVGHKSVAEKVYTGNWDVTWGWIFKYFHLFSDTSEYAKQLKRSISLLSREIEQQQITFSHAFVLSQLSHQKKQSVAVLLKLSAKAGKEMAECDFEALIKAVFEKMTEIRSSQNQILDLLEHIEADFPSQTTLKLTFKKYISECVQKPLSAIVLPPEFESYKELAIEIQPFFSSVLYKHYLNYTKKHESALGFLFEDIVKICKHAVTSLKTDINGLLVMRDVCTVLDLQTIFKPIMTSEEDIDREIGKIAAMFKSEEYWLETIKSALKSIFLRPALENHCKLLLIFYENDLLSDAHLTESCALYLSTVDFVCNKPLAQFLALTQTTENLIYPRPEATTFLTILVDLYNCKPLVAFINNITDAVIVHLKESMNDYDETGVTTDVIEDLEAVWSLNESLKEGKKQYLGLLDCFSQVVRKFDISKLRLQVIHTQNQLNCLYWLIREMENKGEARMSQIEAIHQCAELRFAQTDTQTDIFLCYSPIKLLIFDSAHISKTVNLNDLCELKERASLAMSNSSEQNIAQQMLQRFVALAVMIQRIVGCLRELGECGYPKKEGDGRVFQIDEGACGDLEQFERDVGDIVEMWKKVVEETYARHFCGTFFFGRQFWVLERYFIGEETEVREAEGLLKFAGLETGVGRGRYAYREIASPADRLRQLSEFLSVRVQFLRVLPPLRFELTPESQILNPPGSFIYVETKNAVAGLVSVYLNSGRTLPMAHQVLICWKTTIWVELQAFVYRCFTSVENDIYALVNCDRLPLSIQTALRTLLLSLLRSRSKPHRFLLAVISQDSTCLISDFLLTTPSLKLTNLRKSQLIQDKESLIRILTQHDERIEVVTSLAPGFGKSTYIQQQSKRLSRDSVTLQISGDLHVTDLCEYLLSKIDDSKLIHVQLSLVNDFDIVNDLLMSLGLFRTFVSRDTRVYLPFSYIFIEVANLQPSIEPQIEYLSYLRQFRAEFREEAIVVSEAIFHTCKYLRMLQNREIDSLEVSDLELHKSDMGPILKEAYLDVQTKEGQPLSYRTLKSFSEVFSTLINHFEHGPFSLSTIQAIVRELAGNNLSPLAKDISKMRSVMLECLIATALEVASTSMSSVHTKQLAVTNPSLPPRYSQKREYSSGNHFAIIFMEDGSFVPIYRKVENVPVEFKQLMFTQRTLQSQTSMRLYRIRRMLQHTSYDDMPDFQSMSQEQLSQQIKFCFGGRPGPKTAAAISEFELEKKHTANFVMTVDTFLKMNLIYLRHMAKQPIVIMGETGCGKTFLIRYFVRVVLKSRLIVFNIHAGVTTHELRDMVSTVVSEAKATEDHIWVFFDEFNTTLCVGQICEILCDRKYLSETMPDNITVIVACNPLRLSSQAFEDGIGLRKSFNETRKLVHIVNPLPENALEYVWDFGALSSPDTKSYISTMLSSLPSDSLSFYIDLVSMAHDYFREKEEWTSASLRDVARFRVLYQWFKDTLRIRLSNKPKNRLVFDKDCSMFGDLFANDEKPLAALLAFCNCYYVRIHKETDREEFLTRIETVTCGYMHRDHVKNCLYFDQRDLLARMDLLPDTAINQAFSENISTLFHCIFNRIPLFLCGKPGCSKSYAIQLLFNNCKGEKLQDPFLRSLPELIFRSFQGSNSCTSDDILQVFARAEKYLQTPKLLPVIVFDEIALAEMSKDNPLKVLHGLLELEHVKVGFVGVSNWKLDASKMNRVLYLARPDLSEKELMETGMSLCMKVVGKVEIWVSRLVRNLAETYTTFLQSSPKFQHFYGLRDFYHLIKQISNYMKDHSDIRLRALSQKTFASIYRNFGGLRKSVPKFLQIFQEKYNVENLLEDYHCPIPVSELIQGNLKSADSRFLMLIGNGDLSTFLLEKQLRASNSSRRVCIGSRLPNDLSSKDYTFRSLSEIVLYMEKGMFLVLKDMDHVYSALYDLFNQNFAYSNAKGKRYCRVAVGSHFNPRCPVHDNFKVVVFLSSDKAVLSRAESPFLNRFEKQRIDMADFMTKEQSKIWEETEMWIERLMKIRGEKEMKISRNSVFPIYSQDYLRLLACSKDSLIDCKNSLIETASDDIVLLSTISTLFEDEKQHILDYWTSIHNTDFVTYMDRCPASMRGVVFTQSNEVMNCELLSSRNVYVSNFSAFKCELDFVQDLRTFEKSADRVYLLDYNLVEFSEHFTWLRFTIEKTVKEFEQEKAIFVVARYARNKPPSEHVWWFDNWTLRFFNISKTPSRSVCDLILLSNEDLLKSDCISLLDSKLPALTREAYENLQLISPSGFSPMDHISAIFTKVPGYPKLTFELKSKVSKVLSSPSEAVSDWKEELFTNSQHVSLSRDLSSALLSFETVEITRAYTAVIYSIEKDMAFSSFFTNVLEEELLQSIWIEAFQEMKCEAALQTTKQSNVLIYRKITKFPFIRKDWRLLKEIYKEFKLAADVRPHMASYTFTESFVKKSVISRYISEINKSSELQNIYISDLIDLLIEDNSLDSDVKFILELLQNLYSIEETKLEEKVCLFFAHKRLFLQLSRVALIWKEANHPQFIVELATKLQGFFAQSQESMLEGDFSDFESRCNEFVSQSVESISLLLQPSSEVLSCVESVETYGYLIEKLFNLLKSIANSSNIDFCRLEVLDFWAKMTPVAIKLNTPKETIISIFKQGKELELEDKSYVYNQTFISLVISLLKSSSRDDSTLLFNFEMTHYSILLNKNVNYIEKIAESISDVEIFLPCPRIISKVIDICKLRDTEDMIESLSDKGIELDESLLSLESTLKKHNFDSRFSVLISDALLNQFGNRPETDINYLEKYLDEFKFGLKMMKDSELHVKKLFFSASVRTYLDKYCEVIVEREKDMEKWQNIDRIVGRKLSKIGEIENLLRFYCLKQMKKCKEMTNEKLFEFVRHIEWTKKIDFESGIDCSVPLFPLVKLEFPLTLTMLSYFCSNNIRLGTFNFFLNNTPNEKLAFLIAFWQINQKLPQNTVQIWLECNKLAIELQLSMPIYQLMKLTVNQKLGSILTGEEQTKSSKLRIIFHYLALILTHCQYLSPLTVAFFDLEGNFWSDFDEKFNLIYKIGAESKPQHVYLQSLLKQLKTKLDIAKKKCVCCCPSCEYMCIIKDETEKCKFCALELDMESISLITPAEAIERIHTILIKASGSEPLKYVVYPTDNPSDLPIRGISHVETFRVLHLMLNVSLFFAYISELVFSCMVESLIIFPSGGDDILRYFRKVVNGDFAVIEEIVGGSGNVYDWFEIVLARMPELMKFSMLKAFTRDGRIDFETQFEQTVVYPQGKGSHLCINEYLDSCKYREFDWVAEMEECNSHIKSQYKSLFRMRQTGSFDEMKAYFNTSQCKFPCLRLYIERLDEFKMLKCIVPITELIKRLLQKFNYNISRAEAGKIIMKDLIVADSKLNSLFQTVKKHWEKYLSKVTFEYLDEKLPPKSLSESSPLSSFLPDTKTIEGRYFVSALIFLSNLQNKLIQDAAIPCDYYSSHIQKTPKDRILLIDIEKPSVFADYWACNTTYARGFELYFDFESLEADISKRIRTARILTRDHLELIQYKFEILSEELNLVLNISANIAQEPLFESASDAISMFFSTLEIAQKENIAAGLGAVFAAFNSILSYVAYVRFPPSDPISSLKAVIPEFTTIAKPLGFLIDLSLSNLIGIYEATESRYFPYAKKMLSSELKQPLHNADMTVRLLRNVCEQKKIEISAFVTALERLIMRCLLGRVENGQHLDMYITRADFWQGGYLSDDAKLALKEFGKEVRLEECAKLCKCLKRSLKSRTPVHSRYPSVGKLSKKPSLAGKPNSKRGYV